MKKALSILLVLAFCMAALALSAAAEETRPEPVITELPLSGLASPLLGAGPFKMPSPEGGKQSDAVVYAAYGTPVIDGEIDEIWSSAVPEKYGTDKNDPESHVEAGRFRVLWDADYIYLLFEIIDTTLMPDDLARKDTNWYARDMICVTFNSTGSHEETEDIMPPAFWYGYRPCAVTPNFQRVPAKVFFCEQEGAGATGYQNFTAYPADQRMGICKYTDTGYIVEAKVNLKARDDTFAAYAGKRISFDTWVYGNDYTAERTEAVADHIYPWADLNLSSYRDDSCKGNIVLLAGEGSPTSQGETTTSQPEVTTAPEVTSGHEGTETPAGTVTPEDTTTPEVTTADPSTNPETGVESGMALVVVFLVVGSLTAALVMYKVKDE